MENLPQVSIVGRGGLKVLSYSTFSSVVLGINPVWSPPTQMQLVRHQIFGELPWHLLIVLIKSSILSYSFNETQVRELL